MTRIIDTSALGQCLDLDLSGTKITDISTLGNCRTLYLPGRISDTRLAEKSIQAVIDSGVVVHMVRDL